MKSYKLTRKAQAGLFSILEYVESRFEYDTVGAVLEKIENACQRLAEHPGLVLCQF